MVVCGRRAHRPSATKMAPVESDEVNPDDEMNVAVFASELELIPKVAGARGGKKVALLFRSNE